MSADPSLVAPLDLSELVRGVVAEVLMVRPESIGEKTALVADLGAESLDFLDMVFRLEQALGKRIPVARWGQFVAERLPGQDLSVAITAGVVREFAEREAVAR